MVPLGPKSTFSWIFKGRAPRNPVSPRFGSKGVPIHSPPVVLLSRWKEETASQRQTASQRDQTDPASQPERPDSQTRADRERQTDRADRQSRFPVRQDGRPPGGPDGRPLCLLFFNGKEGRLDLAPRFARPGAASGAKRRERVAGAVRESRTGFTRGYRKIC